MSRLTLGINVVFDVLFYGLPATLLASTIAGVVRLFVLEPLWYCKDFCDFLSKLLIGTPGVGIICTIFAAPAVLAAAIICAVGYVATTDNRDSLAPFPKSLLLLASVIIPLAIWVWFFPVLQLQSPFHYPASAVQSGLVTILSGIAFPVAVRLMPGRFKRS